MRTSNLEPVIELLQLCNELIEALESNYTRAELLGDCPLKDLYLEARKARYNLANAPEVFGGAA